VDDLRLSQAISREAFEGLIADVNTSVTNLSGSTLEQARLALEKLNGIINSDGAVQLASGMSGLRSWYRV
jgi:molecular chaperone DnaK (HSP70)